ncbi:MAG: sigma-54 dependent transcriptional regulator [Ignavibacteriales bacterium]
MKKILIVDDEKEMVESISKLFSYKDDFDVTAFSDSSEAMLRIQKEKFDIILTDLKMKPVSGLDILKFAKQTNPETSVIVLSGYGTIEASVEAIKSGAFNFIEKPFPSKKLFEVIDKALESRNNVDEDSSEIKGFIYNSEKMRNLIQLVKKVAKQEMNVLIVGESGTGKELIARAIHQLSKGSINPFVPVNCGALPETLFESELFGHEKGAFTGAVTSKPGLLEFAEGGTFFFDEIGDMSLNLQVKILRMLEEKKIRRVGGQKEISINVRIVAATNRNLEELVATGKFREDLYYRINSLRLEIPPLRERREDIIPLIKFYLKEYCQSSDKFDRKLTPEAEELLKSYSWPGNVRELQNIVSRLQFICTNNLITENDLPLPLVKERDFFDQDIFNMKYKEAKEKIIEKFELDFLTYYLRKNNGNVTKTAEECGIDRRSIHRLISKYNIIHKD